MIAVSASKTFLISLNVLLTFHLCYQTILCQANNCSLGAIVAVVWRSAIICENVGRRTTIIAISATNSLLIRYRSNKNLEHLKHCLHAG